MQNDVKLLETQKVTFHIKKVGERKTCRDEKIKLRKTKISLF